MDDPATRVVSWHRQPVVTVLEDLRSSPGGLTSRDARERLAVHGPNLLREGPRRTALGLLAGQFTDFMILVLLAAAVVSGLIGDVVDTIAILAIVSLNAAIGFVQEYRAERAMAPLKAMAAPTATVLRDGATAVIPAADLVPGDVVLLEAGRIVPADLRLLEAARLRVEEAALTGESVPAEKTPAPRRRGRYGHADRVRPDRRFAPAGRGGQDSAAAPADAVRQESVLRGPGHLWRRVRRGAGAWRAAAAHLPGRGEPRDGGDPRVPASRGDDLPGARRPQAGRQAGPGATAAGGGDARLRDLHLLGQDRHADAEPDAGGGVLLRRRASPRP